MVSPGYTQSALTPVELTVRSSVSEVQVTFSTTDQNNRVMTAIQPSDFAIVDQDLVVREFRSFTRSEYTRQDVALLVDASGSITPQFRQELSDVVQLITRDARGAGLDDRFSVISFRDLKPTVVCDGNCQALNTTAQFPSVASGGETPLYDSIVFASRMLARRNDPRTRKIVILFSDGADTISLNSFTDALDTALADDVAIYSVDLSNSSYFLRVRRCCAVSRSALAAVTSALRRALRKSSMPSVRILMRLTP